MLEFYNLGLMSYKNSYEIQKSAHDKVFSGASCGVVFFVEHTKIVTLGKNSDDTNILVSLKSLEKEKVSFCITDRGGEVTSHMPGQLVIYPVLPLTKMNLSVRSYVRMLEDIVVHVLSCFSIEAYKDPIYPGIWTKKGKICSVGIRVKKRISYHGLALNVSNALSLFSKIIPCGIKNSKVVSVNKVLQKSLSTKDFLPVFVDAFNKYLHQDKNDKKIKKTWVM